MALGEGVEFNFLDNDTSKRKEVMIFFSFNPIAQELTMLFAKQMCIAKQKGGRGRYDPLNIVTMV